MKNIMVLKTEFKRHPHWDEKHFEEEKILKNKYHLFLQVFRYFSLLRFFQQNKFFLVPHKVFQKNPNYWFERSACAVLRGGRRNVAVTINVLFLLTLQVELCYNLGYKRLHQQYRSCPMCFLGEQGVDFLKFSLHMTSHSF